MNVEDFKVALTKARQLFPELSRQDQIKWSIKNAFAVGKGRSLADRGLELPEGIAPRFQLPGRTRQLPQLSSRLGSKDPLRLEGEGVMSDVGDALVSGAEKLTKIGSKISGWVAPRGMSSKVRGFLDKYRTWKVISLTLGRKPIISLIEKLVRAVSAKIPYDRLMHLFLLIELAGPADERVTLKLERNEVFNIVKARAEDIEKPVEIKAVPLGSGMKDTFGDQFDNFVKEAERRSPDYGAFRYSPTENNCQQGLLSWLKGNDLAFPGVEKFVWQEVKDLIPNIAKNSGQIITDIAGRVKQAVGGQRDCACKELTLLA